MDGFERYREDYGEMSDTETKAQYDQLVRDRDAHPEYLLHQAWRSLWRSFDVYTDNMQDLQRLLDAARENEQLQVELFQNVRPPVVRDAYVRALDKNLHNALAAAVSLVDHSRRHVAEYFPDSDFSLEFESRNAAVIALPEAVFLRRFRNYLLHVGHAPFAMTGTLSNEDGKATRTTIWLVSAELMTSTIFTGAAQTFIKSHPGNIDLYDVMDTYRRVMLELYRWTFDQQDVLSPHGLDILNEFVRRINLTMTKGSHDGRDHERFLQHLQSNLQAFGEGRAQADWQDAATQN